MILFTEINFILKIEPFATWYFPIVWFGYILIVDALICKLKKGSLISKHPKKFLFLLFVSAVFWWIFELVNLRIQNWIYIDKTGATLLPKYWAMSTISFATVLPAVFETFDLLSIIKTMNHQNLHKNYNVSRTPLYLMIFAGVLCFALVFIFPKGAFFLIWIAFLLILDPINYLHKVPSIIEHWKEGRWKFVFFLALAGLACGFLWEFWNYYAIIKWNYTWQYYTPFANFGYVFEMPILGYIGYLPFALSLYAMYHFIKTLFTKHSLDKLNILKTEVFKK